VLLDFLDGVSAAESEIGRYDNPSASIVSWIEVMVGVPRFGRADLIEALFEHVEVRPLTREVAAEAAMIRSTTRIRLPDAVIWATARAMGCVLVTRNTKDFPAGDPGIRVPYTL
jgi:predicted nucleic acid-binding protein